MADKNFPTAEDVAFWDKYDATYGMDAAGSLRKGADSPVMPLERMQTLEMMYDVASDKDKPSVLKAMESAIQRMPMDDPRREMMMRNYIASRKSGIAALGFDPSRTVLTSDEKKLGAGQHRLGFQIGNYSYTKRDPRISGSTPMHEGIHMGIDQLIAAKDKEANDLVKQTNDYIDELKSKKGLTKEDLRKLELMKADALRAQNEQSKLMNIDSGLTKESYRENEIATRALMQKYYGGIEQEGEVKADKEQFDAATAYLRDNPDFLDEIEKMAVAELKRRGRPMGPR